jgi:hypothetical protein
MKPKEYEETLDRMVCSGFFTVARILRLIANATEERSEHLDVHIREGREEKLKRCLQVAELRAAANRLGECETGNG